MFKTRFISMLVLLAAVATGARADWTGGTYTATANENLGAITVNDDATLTINEGVTVTVTGGINVASGTLTVTGPGTLVVNGKAGSNGQSDDVGGNGTPGGVAISGNIVVQDGATVQANGGAGGNGGAGEPEKGGHGANGGVAISGNVTVQGGATVTATGGNGGNGGNSDCDTGGNGGNGGVAITGEVTIQDASTLEATGGNGGKGGNGDTGGGNGGNGGNAFAGTLTYKSGTVTANGGSGGSSGSGMFGGSNGSAGKAFANNVDFTQTTGYSVTDGTSTIGSVLNQTKVVISGGTPIPTTVAVTGVTLSPTSATLTLGETETVTLTATVLPNDATDMSVTWSSSNEAVATVSNEGVVTAVAAGEATITVTTTDGAKTATCAVTVAAPAASTYTVTLKEGTDDATSWTIAPAEATTTGVAAGTEVKATYGGVKKVKSVKAKKKASAEPAGPTAYTLAESSQGMIVGTDGKAYDVADKDNLPSGVTAAGMVAYKSGSNGLVIALADEASTMNWSTANGTTTGAAAHTPTVTGQTWKLPSQAEWKQMFSANGGNQNSYTGLNTALAAAGGDSSKLQEPAYYWSSSETLPGIFANRVGLNNGSASWDVGNVGSDYYRVRACLAF